MTKPAAIMGSLVDARNVGTHKSVKLTVHVPAELAMQVFEAFGWPTMVEPVAIAIARLDPDKAVKPRAAVAPEKKLAQQAGIMCADPVFQTFLIEEHIADYTAMGEDGAAAALRYHCGVNSRAEIVPGSFAADKFDALRSKYLAWKQVA